DSVTMASLVAGNLQAFDSAGNDTFSLGNGATGSVQGDATITGYNTVNVNAPTFGNLAISNTDGTALGVTFNVPGGATQVDVGKTLSIQGGAGNDSVSFIAPGIVSGSTNINLGDGNNTIRTTAAMAFTGNFNATTGAGNDSINIGMTTTIGGNFTTTGGAGNT